MIHHGNGFTWNDVYTMPTYLRNFYFRKLIDFKKEEKKQYDEMDSRNRSKVRFRK